MNTHRRFLWVVVMATASFGCDADEETSSPSGTPASDVSQVAPIPEAPAGEPERANPVEEDRQRQKAAGDSPAAPKKESKSLEAGDKSELGAKLGGGAGARGDLEATKKASEAGLEDPADEDASPPDDPVTLLAELTRLEGRLGQAGVIVTHAADGAVAASDLSRNAALELSPDQCGDVCKVTESICSLSARICDLASTHGDDDRYRNACTRAKTDCDVGRAACTSCGGTSP